MVAPARVKSVFVVLAPLLAAFIASNASGAAAADATTKSGGKEQHPDLSLVNVALSRQRASLGEVVEIRADVANSWGKRLDRVRVRFLLEKRQIGEDRIVSIGPGGTATVKAAFKAAPAGTHDVVVVADPRGEISERNEENNAVSRSITVLSAADPLPAPRRPGELKGGDAGRGSPRGVPISVPIGDAGSSGTGPPRRRITVRSPNGGETLYTASGIFQALWDLENPGEAEAINIIYLKGGDKMYEFSPGAVARSRACTSVLDPHARGFVSGSDYRLRLELLEVHGPSSTVVASDESDRDFSVVDNWRPPLPAGDCSPSRPVSVKYPNHLGGADAWVIGQTYTVQWCTYDASIEQVRVSLRRDAVSGGGSWGIAARAPNRDMAGYAPASLSYTVPDTIPDGSGFRVRVETIDGTAFDESDYPFNVAAWATIDSPNGGEAWYRGRTYTIRWRSGGLSGRSVELEVRAGGAYHWTIATGLPNTGSYSWSVPDDYPVLSTYRIRVRVPRDGGGAWQDDSDETFSLRAPIVPGATIEKER